MKRRAPLMRLMLFVLFVLYPGTGRSATNLQVPVGPRAIGMGGAFTAIADDATALYWNSAGLPWVGHQEIAFSHADLYSANILDDHAAFILPLSRVQAVAVDFYHSGFSDPELDFAESRVSIGYGRFLTSDLSAGATLKYLGRHTNLDGFTVRQGSGVGLDLGLVLRPFEWLRLAGVGQDVFNTHVNYTQGQGDVIAYSRMLRFGAACTPLPRTTLALDVDDHVHVGAEYTPLPPVTLRAGMQSDPRGVDGSTLAFGVGVRWSTFRFDYALEDHSTLGLTSHFGLSMGFNFNPSQIRIERVTANDLYSSLYRSYSVMPFASVRMKNLEDHPLNASVRVMVPGLMHEPSEQAVVLRPRATQDVPLTAVLPASVMAHAGDRPVQVEVAATYQSLRLPRTEKAVARCTAYGPGAIDWSQGLDQAAAFVTTRDPVVEAVARSAVRTAVPAVGTTGIRNLDFAAAIFDAVEALGVTYVPDPNNPYATISGQPKAVDTIYYPRETLARLTGDCDDMTVLFAALLGNVGIRTQFVGVPGHIFLLVSTDLHERNRLAMGIDHHLFVIDHEEVWIPLEATALGNGFAAAWRAGAEAYASWAERGHIELADVSTAQLRYDSGELPGSPSPPAIDAARVENRLGEDQRTIGAWRAEYMAGQLAALSDSLVVSTQAMNELAHVHFLAGRGDQARDELTLALASDAASARTLNNLAVVVAEGDPDLASRHLSEASTIAPDDAGIWLNLGMVRYAAGDSAGGAAPLERGVELAGNYETACALLGIPAESESGSLQGTARMSSEQARDLLRAALKRVPPAPAATKPKSPLTPAPSHWTSRIAGARSSGPSRLTDQLYWKP